MGFGFASALGEIGLPQTEIPVALLAFNLGVETGQLLFICAIVCCAWIISRFILLLQIPREGYEINLATSSDVKASPLIWLQGIEKPMAYFVGSVTIIWTIERTLTFAS